MSCYTLVEQLDDNTINRRARKALGLSLEGDLTQSDINRVKIESGIIKARDQILRMNPKAVIIRKKNELHVSVQVE